MQTQSLPRSLTRGRERIAGAVLGAVLLLGCGPQGGGGGDGDGNLLTKLNEASIVPDPGTSVAGPFAVGISIPSVQGVFNGTLELTVTGSSDMGTPAFADDDHSEVLWTQTVSAAELVSTTYDPAQFNFGEGLLAGAKLTLDFVIEAVGAEAPNTRSGSTWVSLTANVGGAPSIDYCTVYGAMVGELLDIRCTGHSPRGYPLSWDATVQALPGASVDDLGNVGTTALLTSGDEGEHTINVTIDDGLGGSDVFVNSFFIEPVRCELSIDGDAIPVPFDVADLFADCAVGYTQTEALAATADTPYVVTIDVNDADGGIRIGCVNNRLDNLTPDWLSITRMYAPEGKEIKEYWGVANDAMTATFTGP